jgi:hypothetical protein
LQLGNSRCRRLGGIYPGGCALGLQPKAALFNLHSSFEQDNSPFTFGPEKNLIGVQNNWLGIADNILREPN